MMWKDYFSFNKRQRNGIIVLLCIIVVMISWLFVSDHLQVGKENFVLVIPKEPLHGDTNKPTKSLISSNIDTTKINKLSINKSTVKELSKNPSIGYYLAEAIVNYREQHGLYKKVSDLLSIVAIDTATYNKVKPYLNL